MKKCSLNSLKVEMVFEVSLLNYTLARPLSVIGKARHIILSKTPSRCMRVLNDSWWSSRSLDSSYAFTCGIQNFVGREKEVIWAVNGESLRWTNSYKLADTRPLKAFIITYIFSFIICMSWAMQNTLGFHLGWAASIFRSIPPTRDVALFLVFSLLFVSRR